MVTSIPGVNSRAVNGVSLSVSLVTCYNQEFMFFSIRLE